MVIKIIWTETAKSSLKIIFDYYKENASVFVARKIKNKILEELNILKTGVFSGAKEPLLYGFENNYKYLVVGNYKIIYFIDKNKVIISLVFDTRQNPQKLHNIIKKQ